MSKSDSNASILVIYTGGTIGMILDPIDGQLKPFNMNHLMETVPELRRFNFNIYTESFKVPIDSSDMSPLGWIELANIISQNHNNYDGFVILHGTDTMAYTASALSFLLRGLAKPVILTGSQLPIGMIRTDGKENLITALEISANNAIHGFNMCEVGIYFDSVLYRGNRTSKVSTGHFNAFSSPNYMALANAGVEISFNQSALLKDPKTGLLPFKGLNQNIAVLPVFPGITEKVVRAICQTEGLEAVILRTYGSGNAQRDKALLDPLKSFVDAGGLVLNVSQCAEGRVRQRKYQTGAALADLGVISGQDSTLEAAITKLMYCLGNYQKDKVADKFKTSLCGEISV
ncbi:MAG: asparaginase [Flavobacteriales bacterium]|nr:asparaginase [Flavobacteriales bacterium]